MADDLTLGELARNQKRLEEDLKEDLRALGTQIVESNRAMVPAKLHEALQRELAEHIRVSGIDRERLERSIETMRKNCDREIEKVRTASETAITALRAEVTEQPTKWADKAWTRILAVSSLLLVLAGVVVAALSLGKG